MKLEAISKILAETGMKVTHQRLVVFKAMLESKNHPTSEQIYDKVKADNPTISLATVYKILEALAEHHLIIRVSSPRGTMRYDPVTEYHNHIYVTNTNEIMDYYDDELKELLYAYLKKKNFNNLNITDFKLQIKGDKINPKKGISIT